MKSIGDIDKNLKIENNLGQDDIVFYDVKNEPFSLYGIAELNGGTPYKRMPFEVAKKVSEGVQALSIHTAGVRVRFSTNSSYIAIKAYIPPFTLMSHMTAVGQAGFDLYEDSTHSSVYAGSFLPPIDAVDSFESIIQMGDNKQRSFTINFPLYNGVNELYVGIEDGATLERGIEYLPIPPIVYYGSSITQGGCASRPGNAYQSIIARKNHIDYINLGFSGNAKAEIEMAEYIASLKMSVFVSDYDHNSPTVDTLKETHSRLYHIVREKNPDLPIILITKPDFKRASLVDIMRRDVIHTTYIDGIKTGDKNLYYIDGESLFDKDNLDCSTVDNCHPNDFGFVHMAKVIQPVIAAALNSK